MLTWTKDYDDYSNAEYFAQAPFANEFGDPYYWKLSQKLENDKIIWYENHDLDILDDSPCDFDTLEEAKEYVETLDAAIKENKSL